MKQLKYIKREQENLGHNKEKRIRRKLWIGRELLQHY